MIEVVKQCFTTFCHSKPALPSGKFSKTNLFYYPANYLPSVLVDWMFSISLFSSITCILRFSIYFSYFFKLSSKFLFLYLSTFKCFSKISTFDDYFAYFFKAIILSLSWFLCSIISWNSFWKISKFFKLHEMMVYLIFLTSYEYYLGMIGTVTGTGTSLTTYLIRGWFLACVRL